MSEMRCTLLAENTGRKKSNRHYGTIAQLCRAVSSQLRHASAAKTQPDKVVRWTIDNRQSEKALECGPMPHVNIGGALCSTPQSLADAHY